MMFETSLTVSIHSNSAQDAFPPACGQHINLLRSEDLETFCATRADLYIDFGFEAGESYLSRLKSLQPAVLLVNAVDLTLEEIGLDVARFNGWPGFGFLEMLELSTKDGQVPQVLEGFAAGCGFTWQVVPDSPGMIRPRIISMIINEAYHTLHEKISTAREIDTAMKLGTNYPFGPFEWAERIGVKKVYGLLEKLAKTDSKYAPSPGLGAAVQSV
jgi:3-hydroxybutyryl-CoA dehydrogenase